MSTPPEDQPDSAAPVPDSADPAVNHPADTAAAPSAGASPEQPRGTRRHRRAVDPGRGPEPVWHRTAWEDDPRAWGDTDEGESDSDQRILREKPPHW